MIRLLLAAAVMAASFAATAQSSGDWLTGATWVLCERANSQAEGRDALVFEADGSGRVIRAEGNLVFKHQRNGNIVALSTPGAQRPVEMVASADHNLLRLQGPDGAVVASYARQGSAAMAACSAR